MSNLGIPFLAKNKWRKNRFKEDFRIIPKYERRNSEKHRMQLNKRNTNDLNTESCCSFFWSRASEDSSLELSCSLLLLLGSPSLFSLDFSFFFFLKRNGGRVLYLSWCSAHSSRLLTRGTLLLLGRCSVYIAWNSRRISLVVENHIHCR